MIITILVAGLAAQATISTPPSSQARPQAGDKIEVETATAIMLPDLLAASMLPLVSCLFSEPRPDQCDEARLFASREAQVALSKPLSDHDRREIVQVLIRNIETLAAHGEVFEKLGTPDLSQCRKLPVPGPTRAWRCAPKLPDVGSRSGATNAKD